MFWQFLLLLTICLENKITESLIINLIFLPAGLFLKVKAKQTIIFI